jgi:hypothetical protein
MTLDKHIRRAACLISTCAALQVAGLVGEAAYAAPAAQSAGQSAAAAHIAVEHSLTAILSQKSDVQSLIDGNDFERLRTKLAQIREELRQSRLQMDQALLTGGAWNKGTEKQKAAAIIEHMQEVDILSLMGVASISYDYPTHKVPSSVVDSTRKLFVVLEGLTGEVAALNHSLGG